MKNLTELQKLTRRNICQNVQRIFEECITLRCSYKPKRGDFGILYPIFRVDEKELNKCKTTLDIINLIESYHPIFQTQL